MGQGMTTLVLVMIDALKDYKTKKARGATVAALKHAADAPTATEQEQLLQRERFGGRTGRPFDPVVVAREVNKARFRRRMDALHHVRAVMQAQRNFVLSPVPEAAGSAPPSDVDVDDVGAASDTDDTGAGGGEDAPLIRRTGRDGGKHSSGCSCRRHRRSKSKPRSGHTSKAGKTKGKRGTARACCGSKHACSCRRRHGDVATGVSMVCL